MERLVRLAGHDLDRRQAADPVCRGMRQEDVIRNVDHQVILDQRGGAWCCPQHAAVAVGQVTIEGTRRFKASGIEFGPQFHGHGVDQVFVDQVRHGNHAVAAEGRLDGLGIGGSIEVAQRHRLSVIPVCGQVQAEIIPIRTHGRQSASPSTFDLVELRTHSAETLPPCAASSYRQPPAADAELKRR